MFEPQLQSIGINMYNLGLNCSFPALTQKSTPNKKRRNCGLSIRKGVSKDSAKKGKS